MHNASLIPSPPHWTLLSLHSRTGTQKINTIEGYTSASTSPLPTLHSEHSMIMININLNVRLALQSLALRILSQEPRNSQIQEQWLHATRPNSATPPHPHVRPQIPLSILRSFLRVLSQQSAIGTQALGSISDRYQYTARASD